MVELAAEQQDQNPFLDPLESGVFFQGAQRAQVLEILPHLGHYGHFLVLVTGTEGSGKSVLMSEYANAYSGTMHQAVKINCAHIPELDQESFFGIIGVALGLDPAATKLEDILQEIESASARKQNILILIDDAHLLSKERIRDCVLLINDAQSQHLQFVLFAKPEISTHFTASDLAQSFDTLGHHFALPALNLQETEDYIRFRLASSGHQEMKLTKKQVNDIFQVSGGVVGKVDQQASSLFEHLLAADDVSIFRIPRWHLVAMGAIAFGILVLLIWGRPPSDMRSEIELAGHDGSKLNHQNQPESISGRESQVVLNRGGDEKTQMAASPSSSPGALASNKPQLHFFNSSGESIGGAKDAPSESVEVSAVESTSDTKNNRVNNTANSAINNSNSVLKNDQDNQGDQKIVPVERFEIEENLANISTVKKIKPTNEKTNKPVEQVAKNNSVKQEIAKPVSPQKLSALSQKEQLILAMDPKRYTLQLLGARDEASVKEFLAVHKSLNKLGYYETRYKGHEWFVVVQGEFPSREHAQAAISKLPIIIRDKSPWARNIRDIQAAIK